MNKSVLACGLSAAILLTGCGGGGSGGGSSSNPPQQNPTTVSGTAVKGIVQQGLVTAIELDAAGNELEIVGSATTAGDGTYSLQLNEQYQGGIIKLTITANASTQMICDSYAGCNGAAFGSAISLPLDFSMHAVIPAVSEGTTVSSPISPLTHMVAARVLAQPQVDRAAILNAVSELNQLVGVNVLETAIIDITNTSALAAASDNAKQLALFSAGLADLLVNGGNISDQLNALANSFSDGEFDDADAISIYEILNAVSGTFSQASFDGYLEDTVDDLQQVVAVVNSQIESGSYNPEPASNANASEVAQAKALITDARTFLDVIASDYEAPIDALELDKDTIEQIISDQSSANLMLLGEVLDQVILDLDSRGFDLEQELQTPGTYQTEIMDGDTSIGTVTTTIESTPLGLALALSGSLGSEPVNLDVFLATSITVDDLGIEENEVRSLVALSDSLSLSGTIGDETTTVIFEGVELAVAFVSEVDIILDDRVSEDQAAENIETLSLNGRVVITVDAAQFDGDIDLEMLRLNPGASFMGQVISLSRFYLSGVFSPAIGESFSASVEFNVSNAVQFDVLSFLEGEREVYGTVRVEGLPEAYNDPHLNTESILEAAQPTLDFDPDTFQWSASNCLSQDCTYMTMSWSVIESPYIVGTAYIHAEGPEANLYSQQFFSDALPLVEAQLGYSSALQWLNLDYMFYYSGNYYVDYSALIEHEESESNYLMGNLLVTVDADDSALPEATLTAIVNRSQYQGGEALITVAYAGQSFTLDVAGNETETGIVGNLALSNADGVELALVLDGQDDISGTATVNGTQVGVVETASNGLTLIRYNDGTFESLF